MNPENQKILDEIFKDFSIQTSNRVTFSMGWPREASTEELLVKYFLRCGNNPRQASDGIIGEIVDEMNAAYEVTS